MNKGTVFYVTGRLMTVMAAIMVIPFAISFFYRIPDSFSGIFFDPEKLGFFLAIILSALVGFIIMLVFKTDRQLEGIKEGFAIVSVGWVTLGLLGAVPFMVYFLKMSGDYSVIGIIDSFTDAYFEICSGFTTTGASILSNIEAVPKGLLFWRSLTHWLGGMGIITLAIAIFPAMGVSGYHMFKGEVPGPTAERIQPRLAQTAAILWGVYALLTGAQTVLLMFGGMNWFDSLCHTFGTMATGGFSTRNASIGQYNSDYFDWVITVFMFLAGMNFLIHYRLIRGNLSDLIKNREFVFYFRTVVVAILITTAILYFNGVKHADDAHLHFRYEPRTHEDFVSHVEHEQDKISTLYGAFRRSSFQVVSIITTTGYGTADFDVWPDVLRFGLLILMFWGGCAGSTGGGMKMIRIMVVLKTGWRELQKIVKPHLVAPLKIGDSAMDEDRVINIGAFFIMFMVIFAVCSLLMMLFVPDFITAISAVAATIGNIGPGLNGVGSIENYGWIPIPGKWVLIVCMLLGRLEVFTILIALRPSTWQR